MSGTSTHALTLAAPRRCTCSIFFFFNDTATTEIYTLSLHDALPIWCSHDPRPTATRDRTSGGRTRSRSEEHTSELQSHSDLVCRLLLEKKKTKKLRRACFSNFLTSTCTRRNACTIRMEVPASTAC